jgi:23S rRNA (uracil1939-C5)-methyltransferase
MAALEITAMTLGPYGVGHHEGQAVMIPGVVPGDLVDATIVAKRGGYLLARAGHISRAGAARRQPPCRWVPECGGCDWQHLNYADQVRIKGELIAAEFNHAFGIELNPDGLVEPAPEEFGYRARIRLKATRDGALGYHAMGSNRVVPIDCCLVAAAELIPAGFAAQLGGVCKEIEVVADNGRAVLVVDLTKAPGARESKLARHAVDANQAIKGVILRYANYREAVGDCVIAVEPESGCTIRADADQFNQVNRDQNRKLVAAVIAMAEPHQGAAILDLYCGTGNFSLPLARRGARVTGADSDTAAIAAAARNAARMSLDEVQFIGMGALEAAQFLTRARYRPDVVILDPPRTGALTLMEPVARLRPKVVIYVSCDCATLVRDLHILRSYRYEIVQIKAFDFFPNTHHAELAVRALLT